MARSTPIIVSVLLTFACGSNSEQPFSENQGGASQQSGGATGASSTGGAGTGGTSTGTGGSSTGGTDTGTGGSSTGGTGGVEITQWNQADLTHYTSYPDPGSEECVEYNGCMWAGYFAGVDGKQTEQWVMEHNIAAVHSKDFEQYKLKTLRLRKDGDEIDVVVYDMCADSDCSGCCTTNSSQTGFLIDIEKYTMQRFGHGAGIVEWACLDCN